MKYVGLLDTSVLLQLDLEIATSIRSFVSSYLCRAELEFGHSLLLQRGALNDAATLALLIESYDEVPIWRPFAMAASQCHGPNAATAHQMAPGKARTTDAMIASHAIALGLPVITENVKDFQRFTVTVLTQAQAIAALANNQ